jgi:hypothetical protein
VLVEHAAVAGLQRRHAVHELQVGGERDLTPIEMKQVIQREEDVGLAQRRRHLPDIAPQRLDGFVQRLGHAVDAEVHLDRRVGEPTGHFFGYEEVVRAGMAVEELEAPADAVVIGDGDDVHAARFGDAVDLLGA